MIFSHFFVKERNEKTLLYRIGRFAFLPHISLVRRIIEKILLYFQTLAFLFLKGNVD